MFRLGGGILRTDWRRIRSSEAVSEEAEQTGASADEGEEPAAAGDESAASKTVEPSGNVD